MIFLKENRRRRFRPSHLPNETSLDYFFQMIKLLTNMLRKRYYKKNFVGFENSLFNLFYKFDLRDNDSLKFFVQ